jgi:predicted enzyme related to lactoylglutathione lyase
MQWQILAKDPAKLADFYTRLFAWKVNANNALGYRMIETGGGRGINGGIWPSPPEGHSLVSLYIEVDDVAAFVAKAATMGGHVLVPPQKLPDGDEMAIVLDPEGIAFGLFKPAAH